MIANDAAQSRCGKASAFMIHMVLVPAGGSAVQRTENLEFFGNLLVYPVERCAGLR